MTEQQLEAVEEAIGMLMMIVSTIRLEDAEDRERGRLVSHLVATSLVPELEHAALSLRLAFPDTSQQKTTDRALASLREANARVRRALEGEGQG